VDGVISLAELTEEDSRAQFQIDGIENPINLSREIHIIMAIVSDHLEASIPSGPDCDSTPASECEE
jgi:hypothetical protein